LVKPIQKKNMYKRKTGIGGLSRKLLTILLISSSVAYADPIVTQSTSDSTTRNYNYNTDTSTSNSNSTSTNNSTSNSNSNSNSSSTTRVISPPPTAIAPSITSINSDLCTVGASGAVQTQILGISFGATTTDKNCERLKLANNLYNMGMKVAAVSTLCQDERVFTAMLNAGTPCPVDGKIGAEARAIWEADPDRKPQKVKSKD
jgi:cytoskeletal protein RodZ